MISILLSLLRLVLWPRISSIFGEANGNPLQYSCLEIPWTEEPGGLQSMRSLRVRHDWVTSLSLFTFHFHALEKEMATHSSILAWRIPGMGEPGGLPSMGSHRVGHDWRDLAAAAAWSILVYVPHTLENKVYSAVAGQCSVNVNQILLVEAGVEVWFSS